MPLEKTFQLLLDALNRLEIRHMIGGSLASSMRGIPRSTNDIDLVAVIEEEHISPLAAALRGDFYADPQSIREALYHRRSFNVIHFESGAKFDIFPAAGDAYLETQIDRSKLQEVALGEGASVRCFLATAEDIILAKLAWYRAGGEQSDRQWNDVRGVLAVQGALLDRAYMQQWAEYLKVRDLLQRLFSEREQA
jgi:hypothetical protein